MTDSMEPKSSGAGLIAMQQILRETVGEDALARAVASLPSDVRDEYLALTPLGWVRMTTTAALLDATAREARRDPDEFFDDMVRRTTARSFRTIWRLLLGVTSDAFLVSRTPSMYARTRNIGKLSVTTVSRGQATLSLTEWPGITERSARAIGIGIQVVIELAGRKAVRWSWVRSDDGGQFRIAWRA